MTHKNKTLLSIVAIVIIGGAVAFASSTKTFQGLMRSRSSGESTQSGGGSNSGGGSGGGSESSEDQGDSSIKWWCVKEDTGESGTTDTVPPTGTDPNSEGSEEISTEPGTEDVPGTQESDSKNSFFIMDPAVFKTIQENRIKIIIQMFANDYGMLVPTPKGDNTPGKGKDRTPKPKGPKPQKVVINYECSCFASKFTLPEFPNGDIDFWCPEASAEKATTETWTMTENGKEYTINATKPVQGTCQEELKENEEIVVGFTCGCDETTFFIKEINQTFECPPHNEGKAYTGENYYVYASKPPIYYCDPQWGCPVGYIQDWEKINDDCQQLKKDKCSGNTFDAHVELACKAFEQTLMEMKCLDFEDCEKTKELDKKYKGLATPEIEAAGLPNVTDCKEQFGDSDDPSKWNNEWWKD